MSISGVNILSPMPLPKADGIKSQTGKAGKDGKTSGFADMLGQSDNKSEKAQTSEAKPVEKRTPPALLKKALVQSKNAKTAPKPNENENPQPQAETLPLEKSEIPAEMSEALPADSAGSVQSANVTEAQGLPAEPPMMTGPIADRALPGSPMATALVQPGTKQPELLGGDDAGVDSLTRRVVWTDFLRKMKEDLDVSAQDMLEAFAELSDEDLAAPPQQSVEKVVANLGLSGPEAQTAREHLFELVSKTKPKSLGEELKSSEKQISLTLMSQRDLQRKLDQRSVESLNRNFFDAQAKPATVEQKTAPPRAAAMSASALLDAQQTPLAPTAPVENQEAKLIENLIQNFNMPKPKVQAEALAAAPAAPAAATPAPDAAMAGGAAMSPIKDALADLIGSDSEESGEFTSDASYMTQGPSHERAQSLASASSEFRAELTKSGAPQPMSVPDMLEKAQIMVTKGGGEMKVTMSPEGMGEVAMRVNVDKGVVNVQMITESDEAKKMIEKHMHELKSSLSQNNLQVDTIKIDTASNIGKQLEQQYNDAQRQLAQTTLEQFRQDHQGWRRSFFELPSARQYKGQNEAPRDVRAPGSANKASGSRRLDLVA